MKIEGLKLLIQAGNPIISIESTDEPRGVRMVRVTAEHLKRPLIEWSVTEGLVPWALHEAPRLAEPGKLLPALTQVRKIEYPALFLFKDLGPYAKDPQVVRYVRDLYFAPPPRMWTLILLDAVGLPQELRRLTVPFDIGWPDEAELREVVRNTFRELKRTSLYEVESKLTNREFDQVVQTLRGLTADEAARVISAAIHDDNLLDGDDLPKIMDAKRSRVGTMGCLETVVADFGLEDMGGLKNLKRWLHERRGGFTRQARDFGLEPPRGILLLGVQGCGKSLCAKVVASAWQMPLLRLDPGVLYQRFVGESEARMREALAQAESMAPVVLWIDEIEKAFASASSESVDGGLSQRMFGRLLSWMQDHRHPIFLVATANDISRLPAELMRKGRFDEVFFVDLPAAEEREAIFSVHLSRRRRQPDEFDLQKLAATAEGFTGAEIEQAIVSALYRAFSAGEELQTQHIVHSMHDTQPLSVMMAERVEALRTWARGRCVPAD